MAIKTFSDGVALPASDINSFLTNAGLVYINTFTGTSGATLTADGVFTATYTNYKILLHGLTTVAVQGINMGLRAAGVTLGTSGYYSNRVGFNYSTSAADAAPVSNGAIWVIPTVAAGSATLASSASIDIFTPQSSSFSTTYSGTGSDARTTGFGALTGSGIYTPTTSADGFVLSAGGTTFTNVVATVYGYRKA